MLETLNNIFDLALGISVGIVVLWVGFYVYGMVTEIIKGMIK